MCESSFLVDSVDECDTIAVKAGKPYKCGEWNLIKQLNLADIVGYTCVFVKSDIVKSVKNAVIGAIMECEDYKQAQIKTFRSGWPHENVCDYLWVIKLVDLVPKNSQDLKKIIN